MFMEYTPVIYTLKKSLKTTKTRSNPLITMKILTFRQSNMKQTSSSCFRSLKTYFSENSKEVVYLYKYYDQRNLEEMITYYKQDIIVDTTVERHIFDSLLRAGV